MLSKSHYPPYPSPAFNLSQHQGLFPVSQLFISGGQSIGASASASVLPMNIQCWFPLGLTGLISLLFKGLSRVFSNTTIQIQNSRIAVLQRSSFLIVHHLHLYMTPGKTIALIMQTFVGKVMSLFSNMMSKFAIAFLPRNKHLFISWLQLQSAVIWETKKKHLPLFPFFPYLFAWCDGTRFHDPGFLNVEF